LTLVEEYWFDEYYRVYKLRLRDGKIVLTIDVYREGFPLEPGDRLSLGQVSLLYSDLDPGVLGLPGVKKVELVGLEVPGRRETIGVRVYMKRDPGPGKVEEIYRKARSLVEGLAPSER